MTHDGEMSSFDCIYIFVTVAILSTAFTVRTTSSVLTATAAITVAERACCCSCYKDLHCGRCCLWLC